MRFLRLKRAHLLFEYAKYPTASNWFKYEVAVSLVNNIPAMNNKIPQKYFTV